MMQFNYSFYGAKTEDELRGNSLIFRNDKVAVLRKNNMEIIQKSETIGDDLKKKLGGINGILSLSRVNGKYANIHLLTSKATSLDGIERIGYIRGSNETIQFIEYPRGKNAHYSSFYPHIKNILLENGFEERPEGFIITTLQIDLFVEIINQFIKIRESKDYEPIIDKKIDIMFIDGKKYFFNILYWADKKTQSERGEMRRMKADQEINVIKNAIQNLAEICRNAKEEKELERTVNYINNIRKKLDILESIAQREVKQLEEYKELLGI
ncbi:MAG: hypothetical protein KH230_23915 [Enterocloster asparagiformis]|nr:hypothetical protein [Enterocloster asparagiformis]